MSAKTHQPTLQLLFGGMLSLAIASAFVVLNLSVPFSADDYCLFKKDFSLTSAATSAYNAYFSWTGRWPVQFLLYVFLSAGIYGTWLMAIGNAVMLLLCMYLVLLHANLLRFHLASLALMVVFLSMLWFIPDVFGEVLLWKTGHIQYFWGVCLALTCLTPVIRLWIWHEEWISNRWLGSGLLVLSFITGMWLEHVSVAVVAGWAFALISMRLIERRNVSTYHWISLACFMAGSLLLVVAPGNYVRAEVIGERYQLVDKFLPLFNLFLDKLDEKLLLIYLGFLLGSVLSGSAVIRQKILQSLLFILLSVLSALAVVGAPNVMFSGRVAFPSEFFLIIATISVFPSELLRFYKQDFVARFFAVGIVFFTVTCCILLGIDSWRVYQTYESVNIQEKTRKKLIRDVLDAGESHVELFPLNFGRGIHTGKGEVNMGRFFARDITTDQNHWINECYARANNLKTVALKGVLGPTGL